ncbi:MULTISPECIES: hypothetical protein [Pseudomonas]|jgi:hypothetical protein|uniref:Uncharacterized protein n=1 Tax=Pseudomonas psychrophila TaxID=122355 RepID=A0ABY0W2X4_9PSED|nr:MULTISPECIES: hypothetical protein [Pseudomonas]KAB0491362.1 hypothetical protein F7Q95_07185 [Pseudomonas psychrophila]KMN00479.1 hypothetical protein TU76_09380 [Pseudomonas psychrophila]KOX64407.1 hypothetical protein AA303_14245 [Pseudomonas psychrophila]MDY7581473.1 hypothetical protein [Pseudomonas sp. CCI3.1]MEB0067571.1 hypothetical protein [Pseudomonas sp. CCI3.1]
MTHVNKYLATAVMAISLALTGVNAQADVTTLTFEIVNNTSEPLKLNRSSWDLSLAAPGFFDVDPYSEHSYEANYKTSFGYPRKTPATLREVISYATGNRECTFTTALRVTQSFGVFKPALSSTRSASATSTGIDDVKCEARVTEKTDKVPLDYSVRFTMG